MEGKTLIEKIFAIKNNAEFNDLAIEVARFQYKYCDVYNKYCNAINRIPSKIEKIEKIAFLPIDFFRTKRVLAKGIIEQQMFLSSGTTNENSSKHFVADISIYERNFMEGFKQFYGSPEEYCFLALLPSYLERSGSSLVYMVNQLIKLSNHPESGFFITDLEILISILKEKLKKGKKVILIGVSFALLELAEKYVFDFDTTNLVVMETGGMKGKRKEMIRGELHSILCKSFNVLQIHSEYGMTELLSQAYSIKDGIYQNTPRMKIFRRDPTDPLNIDKRGYGAANIIDLANIYSCSFIETQDICRINDDESFEILGRIDNSQIRGCNLLYL